MYAGGKIVKVSSFEQAKIDITSASGALQIKGTVSTGPFQGASGYTHKVYLTRQSDDDHTHTHVTSSDAQLLDALLVGLPANNTVRSPRKKRVVYPNLLTTRPASRS